MNVVKMADPLELLVTIAKDPKFLFVVLGTIFIILSFVKISGKIELIKEEDRNKARAVGAFFLVLGCALLLYPNSVDVFGTIHYWDDTPAVGATIEIDGKTTTADADGKYILSNISRSANRIIFNFNRSICQDSLDIPIYSFSVNKSKKGQRKNLTISGVIYDELGHPANYSRVVFTGGLPSVKARGYIANFTDSSGRYVISNVICDPKYPMFISVFSNDSKELEFKSPLVFVSEETKSRYKLMDINLPPKFTINVYGIVVEKTGRVSSQRVPVSDVSVEMGGKWSDYTDANGNYSIEKVPRNTTIYNITDIDGGTIASELIKPPLDAALPQDRTIRRTLLIP
jgi:hypothetical protein